MRSNSWETSREGLSNNSVYWNAVCRKFVYVPQPAQGYWNYFAAWKQLVNSSSGNSRKCNLWFGWFVVVLYTWEIDLELFHSEEHSSSFLISLSILSQSLYLSVCLSLSLSPNIHIHIHLPPCKSRIRHKVNF